MFKKVFGASILTASAITLASCGGDDVFTIWTFTDEVEGFVNEYIEEKNLDPESIKVVMVPTADFQKKIDLAFNSKNKPDMFATESAFTKKYVENNGWSADLRNLTYKNDAGEDVRIDYFDKEKTDALYPFIVDMGSTSDGTLKGLAWQAAAGAYYVRRSIAEDVFPDVVNSTMSAEEAAAALEPLFSTWEAFETNSAKLKSKGYTSIDSLGGLNNPFQATRTADERWVKDNKLQIAPALVNQMAVSEEYYDAGYITDVDQWSDGWTGQMNKTGKTFGFFLPTWGLHYTLKTNATTKGDGVVNGQCNTAAENNSCGDFLAIKGPQSYNWGGTWMMVHPETEYAKEAADFIQWSTLDTTRAKAYAQASGDFVGIKSVMDELVEGTSDAFLGGQNHYKFFQTAAESVSVDAITAYDYDISAFYGDAIKRLVTDQENWDQAMASFIAQTKNAYPSLDTSLTPPKRPTA